MAKQTYKVTGPREYLGHAPGSVFEADIPADQEERAVAAGHIQKSTAQTKEAEPIVTPAAAAGQVDVARIAARQPKEEGK